MNCDYILNLSELGMGPKSNTQVETSRLVPRQNLRIRKTFSHVHRQGFRIQQSAFKLGNETAGTLSATHKHK